MTKVTAVHVLRLIDELKGKEKAQFDRAMKHRAKYGVLRVASVPSRKGPSSAKRVKTTRAEFEVLPIIP